MLVVCIVATQRSRLGLARWLFRAEAHVMVEALRRAKGRLVAPGELTKLRALARLLHLFAMYLALGRGPASPIDRRRKRRD